MILKVNAYRHVLQNIVLVLVAHVVQYGTVVGHIPLQHHAVRVHLTPADSTCGRILHGVHLDLVEDAVSIHKVVGDVDVR